MESDIDGVATDIAAARVVSPQYVDHLHLVKTTAGRKIANVLFRERGRLIRPGCDTIDV